MNYFNPIYYDLLKKYNNKLKKKINLKNTKNININKITKK